MRHRKRKYNPQGGSLFACIITQGSLLSSATLGYRKYNRVAVVFHHFQHTETNGMVEKRGCQRFQSDRIVGRGICQYIQSDGIFENRGCLRFQSDGMVGRSVCQYIQMDGIFGKRGCQHIQSDGNAWRGICRMVPS